MRRKALREAFHQAPHLAIGRSGDPGSSSGGWNQLHGSILSRPFPLGAGLQDRPLRHSPCSQYRQRAMSSLRAKATMPIRRTRLLPAANRLRYHCAAHCRADSATSPGQIHHHPSHVPVARATDAAFAQHLPALVRRRRQPRQSSHFTPIAELPPPKLPHQDHAPEGPTERSRGNLLTCETAPSQLLRTIFRTCVHTPAPDRGRTHASQPPAPLAAAAPPATASRPTSASAPEAAEDPVGSLPDPRPASPAAP